MDIRKKLVIGTAAIAVLGGLGTTAAMAKSGAPPQAQGIAVSEPTPTTDPDAVQSGDQTSPDLVAAASAASANAGSTSKTGSDENQGEGENQGESDGPGGYQDAPGNANTQFNGEQ